MPLGEGSRVWGPRAGHAAAVCLVGVVVGGCLGSAPPQGEIRPGIEVLLSDSLHLVEGRRVGLLTNQTGVARSGEGDVELLLDANVALSVIFSPEHGFRGNLDQSDIGHGVDSATGLTIYSLYGARRRPSRDMLAQIDVLLVDLQDIGARPYTYISTTLNAMEGAARSGVEVIVLDRPNPIGGMLVQGPMLDTAYASFVGMLPVPLRHGLTLGELALIGNDVLQLGASVTVVPASGWSRDRWYDATGLPWIRPSPNMPSLESAAHYPGLVLFEGTNMSVGRGTPIAFQLVAAPWLDPRAVRRAIGTVPGVALSDTMVTPALPSDRKYPGVTLPAVRVLVTNRSVYDPTQLAVRLLAGLRQVHPNSFRIPNAPYFDQRAGSASLRQALADGQTPEQIWRGWEADVAQFRQFRVPYLLYGSSGG